MKVVISLCFLSPAVSVELCVSVVSEQHMVHVALVSWGLLVRPLSKAQRAVAPFVLLDLSKQPLIFLSRTE